MPVENSSAKVGILGAGLMGCCLALELARRGHRVDLIDAAQAPMTGASLHNEGKLHLGFVYAKDPLRATHGVMARGSLAFSRILQQLTGCSVEALAPSRPFHYYVPVDSQLNVDAIHQHFQRVEEAIHETSRQAGELYVGKRIDRSFERNSPAVHSLLFSQKLTLGSFRTEEVSVSPAAIADIVCSAVANQPLIRFRGNTEVLAVHRPSESRVEVESRRGNGVSSTTYPCVANCLWEGKLPIDNTAEFPDRGPWLLRYKAAIEITSRAAAPKEIPSAAGILGSYGDVVNHGNGTYYVSWYPLCKLAASVGGDGRALRDQIHETLIARSVMRTLAGFPALSRFVASMTHRGFIQDNILDMAAYIPSVTSLLNAPGMRATLSGGVILARGATDIDDPASYLHQRSAIGPQAYGAYVTIDTGKYCTAPLFALQAADMIMGILA